MDNNNLLAGLSSPFIGMFLPKVKKQLIANGIKSVVVQFHPADNNDLQDNFSGNAYTYNVADDLKELADLKQKFADMQRRNNFLEKFYAEKMGIKK